MLRLGTKVRYGGREGVIVARTREAEARYDLLFPETRQIQHSIPASSLDRMPQAARGPVNHKHTEAEYGLGLPEAC